MIGDAEHEVQVGEAIATAGHGEGTHDGASDRPVILVRQP